MRLMLRHIPLSQQAVGRVGWTLIDQGLTSVASLMVAVLAARALPPHEFGIFSVALACYFLVLGISRALASDPLVVRFSTAPESEWRGATSQAQGTALLVGVATSSVLAMAHFIWSTPLSAMLCALALGLPAHLYQDAWRFACFAQRRARDAACNDAVLLLLIVAFFFALGRENSAEGWRFLIAWGLASYIAGFLGRRQAGFGPNLAIKGWITSHRALIPAFVGEFALSNGIAQLISFGVAAIVSLEAAGALRGATAAFGPVNVFLFAAVALAVPEGARLFRRSSAALLTGMALLSLGLASIALGWGLAVIHLLPDTVGYSLLGATWSNARPVLTAMVAFKAMSGLAVGARAGLNAIGRPQASLRVRALVGPGMLIGGLFGAAIGEASGSLYGQVPALGAGAALWWYSLRRNATRSPAPG